MGEYSYEADFPYPAEALFDLVADVERYPEFLPFWAAARIRRRAGNVLFVDQLVRLSFLRWRFSTEAELDRPRRLRITSSQAPFRRLEIVWRFDPLAPRACRVRLEASYGFRSRATKALVARRMDSAIRQYAHAFEQRAREVLG